jgi:ATP-dependent helicase HepA
MLDDMTIELKRLAALRKVNPNVRQEEIDQMKANALELHTSIQASRQRLDSIRVIVTT